MDADVVRAARRRRSALAGSAQTVEGGRLIRRRTDRADPVILSEAKFSRVFDPASGENKRDVGEIAEIGVDLPTGEVETIVSRVFAPSADQTPGALGGAGGGLWPRLR